MCANSWQYLYIPYILIYSVYTYIFRILGGTAVIFRTLCPWLYEVPSQNNLRNCYAAKKYRGRINKFFYLESVILFHNEHLIVTSFLAVDVWKGILLVKLLQILVYFCFFFLHMYVVVKTLFFNERSSKFFSISSETKVSSLFINLLMLVYTLPSQYESTIFLCFKRLTWNIGSSVKLILS